eukprot:CAMPEP_0117560970 /NCGR_PEP_ID=MMETSP0784-20121206/54157_1 /TAXON_ID=39447 /ORGANISM="" /LENGTH=249 /DNA_ID=CAMNT_0005358409 /DNA_START=42 /DNA_END=787 /DNA_ORIENTATION=+
MASAATTADSIFKNAIERVAILHQEEVANLKGEIAALRKKVAELSLPPVTESANALVDLPRSADNLTSEASAYSRRSYSAPAAVLAPGKKPDHAVAKVAKAGPHHILMSSAQTKERGDADVRNRTSFKIVSHPAFDVVIGVVIVANAAKIGYDASLTAAGEERPAWVEVLGYCFLTSYVLELALRVASFGLAAFRNTWVKFDAVLVVFALADALVPLVASLYWPSSAGVFRRLPLIRLLRLARLAQLVR